MLALLTLKVAVCILRMAVAFPYLQSPYGCETSAKYRSFIRPYQVQTHLCAQIGSHGNSLHTCTGRRILLCCAYISNFTHTPILTHTYTHTQRCFWPTHPPFSTFHPFLVISLSPLFYMQMSKVYSCWSLTAVCANLLAAFSLSWRLSCF